MLISLQCKMKKHECLEWSEDEEMDEDDDLAEFSRPVPWKKYDAEGLDCDYALLFSKEEAGRLFDRLETEVVYLTGHEARVQVFGKVYDVPRKQAVYGEPGLNYTYSGVKHCARQWIPTLEYIRDSVTKVTGQVFNFVLVNRYKDGLDHMGEHRDDERELDPLCPIASVSLGAGRDFVFRHRDARGRGGRPIEPLKLQLASGSLLLMNPPTNTYWYHSLPRRRAVRQPRINLTFRRILSSGGKQGGGGGLLNTSPTTTSPTNITTSPTTTTSPNTITTSPTTITTSPTTITTTTTNPTTSPTTITTTTTTNPITITSTTS